MVITERKQTEAVMEAFRKQKVSMAIFCTGSHWNTEAILLAAKNYAKKHNISRLPLTVAMTFNYRHMPQAQRVTAGGNAREGFLSVMEHLRVLCANGATYGDVVVLPHLDHADPARDMWALTKGTPYFASVMFDMQTYPLEENVRMTAEYVRTFGGDVMVEGILEELTVEGKHHGRQTDAYIDKALTYIEKTGIDFLVADLGTEQQSSGQGRCRYLGERARTLTEALKQPMLVLHGTSCLTKEQMAALPQDGVLRVNMWTRIAREAGQYAAYKAVERLDQIRANDFEASESRQYLEDLTVKAAEIMEETLDILGYDRLSGCMFDL